LAIGLLGSVFDLGLRIAAPLLCLVFLETVALGFIARTVPQMNILSIGFPLRILLGFMVLVASIRGEMQVFIDATHHALRMVRLFFGAT
jgi:flagellar biosynthetic protein FliR